MIVSGNSDSDVLVDQEGGGLQTYFTCVLVLDPSSNSEHLISAHNQLAKLLGGMLESADGQPHAGRFGGRRWTQCVPRPSHRQHVLTDFQRTKLPL